MRKVLGAVLMLAISNGYADEDTSGLIEVTEYILAEQDRMTELVKMLDPNKLPTYVNQVELTLSTVVKRTSNGQISAWVIEVGGDYSKAVTQQQKYLLTFGDGDRLRVARQADMLSPEVMPDDSSTNVSPVNYEDKKDGSLELNMVPPNPDSPSMHIQRNSSDGAMNIPFAATSPSSNGVTMTMGVPNNEIARLQDQIDELRAEIKHLKAQIRNN